MDFRNFESCPQIFVRSVRAFAPEPTAENFNRYRIEGRALDAARGFPAAQALTDLAVRSRRRGMRPDAVA